MSLKEIHLENYYIAVFLFQMGINAPRLAVPVKATSQDCIRTTEGNF